MPRLGEGEGGEGEGGKEEGEGGEEEGGEGGKEEGEGDEEVEKWPRIGEIKARYKKVEEGREGREGGRATEVIPCGAAKEESRSGRVWSYLCFPIRSNTSRCEKAQGWGEGAREDGGEDEEMPEEGVAPTSLLPWALVLREEGWLLVLLLPFIFFSTSSVWASSSWGKAREGGRKEGRKGKEWRKGEEGSQPKKRAS